MFEKLAQKALGDSYFWRLLNKAELICATSFLNLKLSDSFDEKEFTDLLRFADILSHSSDPEAKNLSYKIISLLVEIDKDNPIFSVFATAILAKIGNFPALKFLSDSFNKNERLPFERELERTLKEEVQRVPNHEKQIFTDSQYKIFQELKDNNHYSFSGPTSLGKSFIIEAFVHYIVSGNESRENIIILVPTRALINQVSIKLKNEIKYITDYKVLTHPSVPAFFQKNQNKYIFVFTPERLISFLSDPNNPKIGYLFVDEAQKITSVKDSRSPLYYHSILQAERKSIKLFFSSPNIPNPEIFLQIFEKSTDEKICIKESPVAQNKFFLDLTTGDATLFYENKETKSLSIDKIKNLSFLELLEEIGRDDKNIIYCNTIQDTISYAINFSNKLSDKDDPRIKELIKLTEDFLHKDYYLIDCLKKGVAFHFGKLPQRIRIKVEELFRDKVIDYVFCTSTLLEGVNLPARNIFILNNKIGLSTFKDIDFWNLAGRAGRLTKELSGNIICVKDESTKWKNPEKDLEIIKNKEVQKIEPVLIKGNGQLFKNLENSLKQQSFTKSKPTQAEKDIWNYYANIALIHEIRDDDSVLRSNFIDKNKNARALLIKQKQENKIPEKILTASSSIKAFHQNKIYDDITLNHVLTENIDFENCLKYLERLCNYYDWKNEEGGGVDPLIKNRNINVLRYYALLMSSWMSADPISKMIILSIKHYQKEGEILIRKGQPKEIFNPQNKKHINTIINNLMGDIENKLRFKLEKYFNNYYLLLKEKFGEARAGENWAEFLEYGTTNRTIIELQNVGFSRHLAKYIMEKHMDCLTFYDGLLDNINYEKLEEDMDKKSDEYSEYKELT